MIALPLRSSRSDHTYGVNYFSLLCQYYFNIVLIRGD